MIEIVNGFECKQCVRCKRYRLLACFTRDNNIKDGYACSCKECRKPTAYAKHLKPRAQRYLARTE